MSFAAKKGLMPATTAGALRSAVRKVLVATEGEGWADVDLTSLDLDEVTQRFERLRTGRYKPDSMLVYKSRFKNAVSMYLNYVANPSGWRYRAERPAASRGTGKKTVTIKSPGGGTIAEGGAPAQSRNDDTSTIDYPYPLRAGLVVRIKLPTDLTKHEATRLAAFLDSLAIDGSAGGGTQS